GCGGKESGPDRHPVSGTVQHNEAPLETGTIFFVPNQGGGGGSSFPIENGKFGSTEENGLSVGTYRIEITSAQKTGNSIPGAGPNGMVEEVIQVIPAKYNSATTLDATVGEDDANQFEFTLTGKAR
ncbi:MAG: hypothetical protein WEE51_07355, partial [Pirellulaceae bacterium]